MRILFFMGVILFTLAASCGKQRGEKQAIDPVVIDLDPPQFIEEPYFSSITTHSVELVFIFKDLALTSITIAEDLDLKLTHEQIKSAADGVRLRPTAYEPVRVVFQDLTPDTSYNIHMTFEDINANLVQEPVVLSFRTLEDNDDVELVGEPPLSRQGVMWSFRPENMAEECRLKLNDAPPWMQVSDDGLHLVGIPEVEQHQERSHFKVSSVGESCHGQGEFAISVLTDPLYAYSWHLQQGTTSPLSWFGSTLEVNPKIYQAMAQGYTGKGINIKLVDSGMQINHPDLKNNIDLEQNFNLAPLQGGGCEICDTYDTSAPVVPGSPGDQGTVIAGIIAAEGWNGEGGRGVAPEAKISAYNLSASRFENVTETDYMRIFTFDTDILCHAAVEGNAILEEHQRFSFDQYDRAQKSKVNIGRDGKGIIYIKAAGELGLHEGNAALDQRNVTSWSMIVGSYSSASKKSSRSSEGANIWMVAPGGEAGYQSDYELVKDDINLAPSLFYQGVLGPDIFNEEAPCTAGFAKFARYFTDDLDIDPVLLNRGRSSGFNLGWHRQNRGCRYTGLVANTAAAAGIVAGASALLLEANPSLTWRDVKRIFAQSAQPIDSALRSEVTIVKGSLYEKSLPWIRNAAGYNFQNKYGFGALDLDRALAIAKSPDYHLLGPQFDSNWLFAGSPNLRIPGSDISGVYHDFFQVQEILLESVQIKISVIHSDISSLSIELISPQGTKSILKSMNDGAHRENMDDMVFLSNAFYGESSRGNWQLRVVDGKTRESSGHLLNWSIRITGYAPGS